MTNSKSAVIIRIEKIVKCLTLLFTLFLLTACGGNTRINLVVLQGNGNLDDQVTVPAQELRQILTDHFGYVNIKLTDTKYALPDNGKLAQLDDFVHCPLHGGDSMKPAGWDCDDYSIAAMVPMRNYAFGTMYVKTEEGARHALNVFINRKKEVKYWEPQTCGYYHGRFQRPELIIF